MDMFQSNSNKNIPKSSTTVLIITSNNDETDANILRNLIHSSTMKSTKRSINDEIHNQELQTGNMKRRKADLTCVVCGGAAFGYNFGQITCESCKAFFRRNAFQIIENISCRNKNGVQCNIRHDQFQKCQRCRLMKCFQSGMRKDLISTKEEKLNKQICLEQNRRMRLTHIKTELPDIKIENIELMSNNHQSFDSYQLTQNDWSYLDSIQNAYLSASRSIPLAQSMLSLELASDKMSTYMSTLDLQNFGAVQVINFLRQIQDFEQLNEHDRVILVKYNLNIAGVMRFSLAFDKIREIWYIDPINNTISSNDEAFAEKCKSLYILCYGYELYRSLTNILHQIENIIGKDPIIIQLLMLIMIFLKGLSANEDQQPMLNDYQRVFYTHSKYVDLLFRYLIEQSSFDNAVMKMMHIVEVLIKIQKLVRDFQQQVKNKIDVNYVNPLMQSLLHLT